MGPDGSEGRVGVSHREVGRRERQTNKLLPIRSNINRFSLFFFERGNFDYPGIKKDYGTIYVEIVHLDSNGGQMESGPMCSKRKPFT